MSTAPGAGSGLVSSEQPGRPAGTPADLLRVFVGDRRLFRSRYLVGCGGRQHAAVTSADGAVVVAVSGLWQGDRYGAVAVRLDGYGPALITALGLPDCAGDAPAADGKSVVPDPGVAGVDILAEAQVKGERAAVVLGGGRC